MLEELDIQNFALIDKAHIDWKSGFTVLTGETGAGKSILIGSLAFLLGGKGGAEQIRTGKTEAMVSGVFLLKQKEAFDWLSEHGILCDENRILLRRLIRDTGKSSAWIGSTPVTRADLLAFSAYLVDLHGQHEQQSLMKIPEHRRYLDKYAGLEDEVKTFTALYTDLVEKRRTLESLMTGEAERNVKADMLSFAIKEIAEAKLKEGEDEELSIEENKLSSFEKLCSSIEEINGYFEGESDSSGITSLLRKMQNTISHATSLDKSLESLASRFQSAFYEIDDIASEFRHYASSLVFDPQRLSEVQERLDLLFRLKKKYAQGSTSPIAEVIRYQQKAQEELEGLTHGEENREAMEKAVKEAEKQVYTAAAALSAKRKAAAQEMSHAIEQMLSKLGMASTRFIVKSAEKPGTDLTQKCGPYGMDDIEFLISANPGSPLLPLAKIASGGELSRVMLAIKTVLSDADTAETLIFDEIDTGIGGEIAVALGSHMKNLAKEKQILCITHLASIAVYADNHIKIQKGVEGGITATNVFSIENGERVKEIARMLSGDATSQESLEHAAALLDKFRGQ